MKLKEKGSIVAALLYVVISAVLLVVASVCMHLNPGTPPNAPIVHWLGAALIVAGVAWILALGYLVCGR
jgi:hypothetical protein